MPVIVTISPKGGVGKTTSTLVLAEQLAKLSTVVVIDADPNRPIRAWAAGPNTPENLHVISDADEENILDVIEAASEKATFVLVDLEGSASKIVLLAVSQANLVIIPMQGSQLDADQAGRALRVVKQQEKMARMRVPYSVLLNRTSPTITPRGLKHITQKLSEAGVEVFKTALHDREAFRAMFAFAQPLSHLDPKEVSNLPRTIENAEAFAREVLMKLRAEVEAA